MLKVAMPFREAVSFSSSCQKARVISERWAADNLFCPNCPSNKLSATPPNTKAIDFVCPDCAALFQLKSQASPIGEKIVDAGYDAMIQSINSGRVPNLLILHYEKVTWTAQNLILVPHYAFSASAIQKRNPLAATARRAGWVGCNILLSNIPPSARISVVVNGAFLKPSFVRNRYNCLKPLERLPTKLRGWALDVLRLIQANGWTEFTTCQAYSFEAALKRLYPSNKHIKEKIRQQLQVLRDQGILLQAERGCLANRHLPSTCSLQLSRLQKC
jgi:type II restriction enzyme